MPNPFLGMVEQLESTGQRVSRFLEPFLEPLRDPRFLQKAPEVILALKAYADIMQAYGGDKEAHFRTVALGYLGREPDAFLLTRLRGDMRKDDFDETPVSHFYNLLARHKARLVRDSEANSVQERNAAIRKGIKVFPSFDLSLEALALEGQRHEEVLEEMIPGVVYIERAKMASDANLAGLVANQIRREGVERPDKPELVFAPGSERLLEHTDELELAAFAVREQLARMPENTGVTEQEWEAFVLGTVLGNQEAAKVCGRPANQVGVERSRALKKLRQSA